MAFSWEQCAAVVANVVMMMAFRLGDCASTYAIQSGDTCYNVATQNGLTLAQFESLNPGIQCDSLQVGTTVNLSGNSGTTSSTPSESPASPKSNPPASPESSSPSGGVACSQDEFSNAVTGSGYSAPSSAQYQAFNNYIGDGGFSTKRELAMFLAECILESAGLAKKTEDNPQPGAYANPSLDQPGQEYYGRGYIMLTGSANYKAASEALYNDEKLLDNPGLVSSSEDYAWQVSFWYWKTNVGSQTAVKNGMFGAATKAINGVIECSGGDPTVPKKRFAIYVSTLSAFNVNESPQEGGCYN